MASQPPQLPTSIVLGQFSGIRNTVERERLKQDELVAAVNVDLDDTGQARRRRGYALKLAGDCHSLRNFGSRMLVVKDGELGDLYTDYTFAPLGATVGPDRLSYTQVGDTIFFSSLSASGKIIGDAVHPWGQQSDPGGGAWISPVMTPTDSLGQVFGKTIVAPPTASEIEAYRGRIYLAAGPYLWATELFLFDYIDRTRNFLQFEDDITMLAAMQDGLYVGTKSALWFLEGNLSDGLKRDGILDCGVIPGSKVMVRATEVHPNARQGPMAENMAAVLMTTRGVCAGFDGGEVHDLTRARVEFPAAQSAAALYREDSGVTSYVAVTNGAGGPSANARIGDYVDAEIVRGRGL